MNPTPPSKDLLDAAVVAAARAAAVIRDLDRATLDTRDKRAHDLVTAADHASQEVITRTLQAAFPDIGILGEEGLDLPGAHGRWIVDPLDGTTNFVHDIPQVAVSIGLEWGGVIVVGVVHDVYRDEVYRAVRGQGASCQGQALRVSDRQPLAQALVATGFPTGPRRATYDLGPLDRVLRRARCLRRAGAAALDLAWVARGRLDAFWEVGLGPWDTAAGSLLVEEAGGWVSGGAGEAFVPGATWVVASNGRVHGELLQVLDLPP